MSTLLSSKIAKVGFVAAVVLSSFGASAKQISLQQFADYTMAIHMQHVQFDVLTEIEQNVYDSAYASLQADALMPNKRPVVSITELSEEDEE